jgi:hypothetical protein
VRGVPYRLGDREYNGVFLGWNREHASGSSEPPVATYSIELPDNLARDWKLDGGSALTLSVAVTEEKAPALGEEGKGRSYSG